MITAIIVITVFSIPPCGDYNGTFGNGNKTKACHIKKSAGAGASENMKVFIGDK